MRKLNRAQASSKFRFCVYYSTSFRLNFAIDELFILLFLSLFLFMMKEDISLSRKIGIHPFDFPFSTSEYLKINNVILEIEKKRSA